MYQFLIMAFHNSISDSSKLSHWMFNNLELVSINFYAMANSLM